MATKRTDAFDLFLKEQERQAADVRAARRMTPQPHSTLKGMGQSMNPLQTPAVGTIPPPMTLDEDEEVLVSGETEASVSAETQITANPLFVDDAIELIEESGLLVLEPEDSAESDAQEISSSFLIEDIDGSPDFMRAESLPDLSDLTEEIHEQTPVRGVLTARHAPVIRGQGELVELERPRLPRPERSTDHEGVVVQSGLYNESAVYSDGIPRISARSPGLSSKTLRVPAPRKAKASIWLRNATIGVVFAAGIGAGVGFAVHSASPSTAPAAPLAATTPTPTQAAAPVAVAAVAAPEAPAEVQALEVQVQPLPPQVQPLQEETLALAESAEDEEANAEAEEANAAVVTAEAEVANAETDLPVVRPLEVEAPAETTPSSAPKASKSTRSASTTKKSATSSKAKRVPGLSAVNEKSVTKQAKADKKKQKAAAINAVPDATSGDPGVLMLAAKPPCQIRIDGKTTGLTTPQRVLKLAPGKHRITLINQEHQIKDSFKVSIVSGQKTRIVRDNTSKIK